MVNKKAINKQHKNRKIIGSKAHRAYTLQNWKYNGRERGVIGLVETGNYTYDELYDFYIKETNCHNCDRMFTHLNPKSMDHDHTTGKYNWVICRTCNYFDNYLWFD